MPFGWKVRADLAKSNNGLRSVTAKRPGSAVKVLMNNCSLCRLFLSLSQAVQDELQGVEQQLQNLSHVVSSLHPHLTDSAVDDVDRELRVLREQLCDLESETAQVADEAAEAYESNTKLQAQLADFDSRLQAADQSVAELSYMYMDEPVSEDTAVKVSLMCVV